MQNIVLRINILHFFFIIHTLRLPLPLLIQSFARSCMGLALLVIPVYASVSEHVCLCVCVCLCLFGPNYNMADRLCSTVEGGKRMEKEEEEESTHKLSP